LRDVIEIPDFKNIPDPNSPRYVELKQTSQYNPAFVLMQYFGYLHRDLDRTGYDFWLDVVNNREPNNYHGMSARSSLRASTSCVSAQPSPAATLTAVSSEMSMLVLTNPHTVAL
jgi:hypothetical protein